MKRKIFLLSLLLFFSLGLLSQSLPVKDSLSVSFFKTNFPAQTRSMESVRIDTSFTYRNLTVYNFSTPPGFVILRDLGEKFDVVGYDWNSHFSFDADTTGFLLRLADGLSSAPESAGYAPGRMPALKTGRTAIEPLIRTLWNQGWPYNYFCPIDPGIPEQNNRTLVGCVAVAMAQIIRYWDHWNDWSIYYSYTHADYGTLTCNSGHYNWESMENTCYAVNNEVASLLSDCGILVNMGYSRTGSGASSTNAAMRFNEMYHTGYLNTTLTNEEEFYTNVSNYLPMYATYPGHAFVCDGYDGNGFYHFNLGWGGSANGYYSLSSVVGKALTSAMFNVYPDLPNKPPRAIQKSSVNAGKIQISWTGPDQDRATLTGYKVYLDDKYLTDSPDSVFIHDCVPGDHYVKVSAQFQSGESRWIGPVSYYYDGNTVTISDATLRRALNTAIGISSAQVNSHVPTEGELSKVTRLNVSNALSLSGIEKCINLRQLYLYSTTGSKTLDMEPVGQCSLIALLTIEKYGLINPSALGNLKRLNELRLVNNQLTDPGFLNSLTQVTRLEIQDNDIKAVNFLNSMQRVEWLVLKNCGITDFSSLENTYGFRYVDISYNHITTLDWINQNRSLQTLIASNNNITGDVSLSGFSIILSIDVSYNSITSFALTASPLIETLNISNNAIAGISQLLADNPDLTTLAAHHNKITELPDLSSKLTKLELQNNKIRDIANITRYSSLTYLNFSGNQIVDLDGITSNEYHKKLSYLNLLGNPVSKESFLEVIPVIKASGITASLPATYHPGSPCYLSPGRDTSLISKTMRFTWQADFNNQGYTYRLFLSRESGAFEELASGITNRYLDYVMPDIGKYNWYVVSEKDSLSLQGRTMAFKVMKGFSIPFIDDFELYTPNMPLCTQSPYWKINDPACDPAKDAAINSTRAYQGVQSIKVSGTADIIFPVSEYLRGSTEIDFLLMVEKSRSAFISAILSDKSTLNLYFYSEGIIGIYKDATLLRTMTYKSREWLTVSIGFTEPSGYYLAIDGTTVTEGTFVNTAQSGITSIRLGTVDGPGYYAKVPAVFYVDNFSIAIGHPLSTDSRLLQAFYPGRVIVGQGNISVKNIDPTIRCIRVYSTDGRQLYGHDFPDSGASEINIRVPGQERMFIIVMYDSQGRAYPRKVL